MCTALDRELVSMYNLTLTVTDRGSPPLSSQTVVTVEVLDDNDNVPMFSQSSYAVTVLENTPINSLLIQLSASDEDIDLNGLIIYSFASSTMTGLFHINDSTGAIYSAG